MPIDETFHVEICDWANAPDRRALESVRDTVFVVEQHVPPELERDADDARAIHALARTPGGTPIGAGRLVVDAYEARGGSVAPGRIGRMAVLHEWRGRGVGTALLETLMEQARARGVTRVALHAQHTAIPFYRTRGFAVEGGEFEEAGIMHVTMHRSIAPPEEPPRRPAAVRDATLLRADSREQLIDVTRTLLAGTRRSLCLLVRELHPLLLNDTACLVQLRRIAISGNGASIRILVQDLTSALSEGMRLIALAQRLPSVFELRRPVEAADLGYPSAFMCSDTQGYLLRPVESEMTTAGSTYAPGRHAELMGLFEDIWARAEPWPELRTLGI